MKVDTVEVELKAKDVDKIKENIFLKEIVRCKDCKYFMTQDCPMEVVYYDGYCSCGEKKEQENE